MAKELSMMERNEKGRMTRRYFIQCEKEFLETKIAQNPENVLSISELRNILKSVGQMARVAEMHGFQEYARILALVGVEKESVAIEVARAATSKKYLEQVALLTEQKVDQKNLKTSCAFCKKCINRFCEQPGRKRPK